MPRLIALDCVRRVHALIDRDISLRGRREQAVDIYLGDYVDRGPDFKGVVDRGPRDHEILMERFCEAA